MFEVPSTPPTHAAQSAPTAPWTPGALALTHPAPRLADSDYPAREGNCRARASWRDSARDDNRWSSDRDSSTGEDRSLLEPPSFTPCGGGRSSFGGGYSSDEDRPLVLPRDRDSSSDGERSLVPPGRQDSYSEESSLVLPHDRESSSDEERFHCNAAWSSAARSELFS